MENEEVQIINSGQGLEVFEAQERASIDIQISTAKKYPRDIMRVLKNSITIVSMSEETAKICRYSKPIQGQETVSGPSVHMARILAQQYGNIRVVKRIKQITDKTVIAEAVAFDLETNYAVCVEARRSIFSVKNNRRFSETTIETNAMAIMAIAERNAILQVIPRSISDEVYKAAYQKANGDLSDEQKILVAREKAMKYFKEKHDATEPEILHALGLRNVNQINAEKVAELRGFIQSLKDGEIDPDQLFGRVKPEVEPSKGNIIEAEKKTEPGKLL